MNCLSFRCCVWVNLFHFGLHGAAECNFTPELLQQTFVAERPSSRAKESVRRFGGEIEGIAPEGDHQITVERPSQLRHTVHHRGGQYHTGLDLVVGEDRKETFELGILQVDELRAVLLTDALEGLCQIADLVFQVVGQQQDIAPEFTLRTAVAEHPAERVHRAFDA